MSTNLSVSTFDICLMSPSSDQTLTEISWLGHRQRRNLTSRLRLRVECVSVYTPRVVKAVPDAHGLLTLLAMKLVPVVCWEVDLNRLPGARLFHPCFGFFMCHLSFVALAAASCTGH